VHTLGLVLWYLALGQVPLADTTAIGFTTPLFIMLGAWLFLREPMRWERWLATGLGFAGMLIVISPQLSWGTSSGPGWHHLLMLGSAPLFAASFLLTKNLTRTESSSTIVLWQALTITVLSLPLAVPGWQPLGPWLWAGFVLSGLLGSAGQYCITQSFRAADISATQSVRFLDLIWAAWLGWVLFGEAPTVSTLVGGLLISAATVWVTRRESHLRAQSNSHAASSRTNGLTASHEDGRPSPGLSGAASQPDGGSSGPGGSDRPR
jgi:drug/metabolite transporter (DMT)-like permease